MKQYDKEAMTRTQKHKSFLDSKTPLNKDKQM